MTNSEAAHKYLLKTFYETTNKKEYKLQILEHNIRYTKVLTMQDVILIAKVPVGIAKKKELIVDIPDAEVIGYAMQQIFCRSIIGIWILRTIKQL